jgi:exonuclease SbcC
VLGNPLLDQLLQQQVQRRNEINTTISANVNRISEIKKGILDLLNRELANSKNATTRLNLQKNQLAGSRDTLRERLQQVDNRRKGIFARINGESFADYSAALQRQLEQLQKSAQEKLASISTLQKQLDEQRNFIDSWKKTIQNIETGIRSYRLTDEYINVDQFLRKKGFLDYGPEQMEGLVADLLKALDDAIAAEQRASGEVKTIAEELKDYNELKLQSDIDALRESLAQNSEITRSFERFVNQFLPLKSELEPGTELDVLKAAEKNSNEKITKFQALIEEFEKIEGFKNNLMPLLRYMDGQRKIEAISSRITFLTEKVRQRLDQEKNRLAAIIDQQIQSFFYEDLINQLYKKIDPHPNYKTIKFKCDFSELKPKLNVFVSGSEDEYIIPNLYFSTAQTNILSLSIFLAKALNARDDSGQQINCIFIDDPIQSLDSINILSTIDLIRSLVVNFEKQIILSTHDENFHHLLQKKIPSEMFNSKFLELETFGKVKN